MVSLFFLYSILISLSLTCVNGNNRDNSRIHKTFKSQKSNSIIFEDDFNTLDFNKWQHEKTMSGGGNWEFEWYVNNRSISYINNGVLYIKPGFTSDAIGPSNLINGYTNDIYGGDQGTYCTMEQFYGCFRQSNGNSIINPIMSARLRTVHSFSFKYGKIEIRAMLPAGDWIWPAMWLLPKHYEYGNWPASGEIDIMESRGNDASYSAGGFNTFGSTLHWGPYFPDDAFRFTHKSKTAATSDDLVKNFHTYGLIWNQSYIGTYFDSEDNIVLSQSIKESFWTLGGWSNNPNLFNPWSGGEVNAPFDKEFYILLNVAVGGTNGYFPDGVGNKPWSDSSSTAAKDFWNNRAQWMPTWKGTDTALKVDSIKVWSL